MLLETSQWMIEFVAAYGFGGLIADVIMSSTAREPFWNPAWPLSS